MQLSKTSVLYLILSIFLALLIVHAKEVKAIENPQDVPNNKFGIHILDEHDLTDAAKLVNSEGGDWGYATLVIRRDERDIKKWQRTFDKMRRLHLVPIVRIATRMQEDYWEKFEESDIDSWVYFLNSLNWVIKNRYVVVGNEPNHAKEWGGEVKPDEYAGFYFEISKRLKEANEDFFIMPAGFDASAPNDNLHMSQSDYIVSMLATNPNVFEHSDGWSSHSYPNPNFSGSENDSGRGSVRTFEWELEFLRSVGINKDFPVFITETGWAHNKDGSANGFNDIDTITQKLKNAYNNAWNDERIVAVTPFLLNYNSPPFDIFSWKKQNGEYYDLYYDMQNYPKTRGKPRQINTGEILAIILPPVIKRADTLQGLAYVTNTGQTIWYAGKTYVLNDGKNDIEKEPVSFLNIEPGQKGFVYFRHVANGNNNN